MDNKADVVVAAAAGDIVAAVADVVNRNEYRENHAERWNSTALVPVDQSRPVCNHLVDNRLEQ